MGLFVIIVLGESILGVVVGLAGHEWDIYSSLSVGLGLSIPFSPWWIYFDNIGGSAIRAATEKGKRGIYYIWLYVHFPLVVGLTAIGIGIKQVAASNQEILYLFQIFGLFVVQYPAVCLFRQYFIW
jgi:low temperature requirement protein LtrA